LGLLFEHPERIVQRGHAIPTKFHVVIQAATNDMQMRVVKSGNNPASVEVNNSRVGSSFVLFLIVHADYAAIFDNKVRRLRVLWIERSDPSIV